MPDVALTAWIPLAAALGAVASLRLTRLILRIPAQMEADWRREAHDVLELEFSEAPASIEPGPFPALSPAIAVLTALLTAVVVWRFGVSWAALAAVAFTWMLIVLSGIDSRTQLLPDQLTLPLLWLGLLAAVPGVFVAAPQAILGAALGYASLWGVNSACRWLTGADGLGQGDFKLLAALGAWMGPAALLPILLVASLIGFAYKCLVLLRGRHARGTPFWFPFGPCLAIGGWCWLIAGDAINQHWGLFR